MKIKKLTASFVLGITGNSGTGKTTLAKQLAQLGAVVIDGDELARQLTAKNQPLLKKLTAVFGQTILLTDGSLNRKQLGALVFEKPAELAKLNALIQPAIRQEIHQKLSEATKLGTLVVLDLPLLFEQNYQELCDKTLVCYAPKAILVKRIMARDNVSQAVATNRLAQQMPYALQQKLADGVIDTSKSSAKTLQQLGSWLQKWHLLETPN